MSYGDSVSESLRDLLAALDVSQAEIARRLRTSPANVSQTLERANPTAATVERICAALGVFPRLVFVDDCDDLIDLTPTTREGPMELDSNGPRRSIELQQPVRPNYPEHTHEPQDVAPGVVWVIAGHPDEEPGEGHYGMQIHTTDEGLVIDVYDVFGEQLLASWHRTYDELVAFVLSNDPNNEEGSDA